MRCGNRFIAVCLAVVMMVSAVPAVSAAEAFQTVQTYTAGQFPDVESGQWYESVVQKAYELGLMSGDPNGSFRPEGQVTLAEAVTVAARIHALAETGTENFVQGTPWYQVYVDYALQNGILAEALANYDKAATRLEFARLLSRALPDSDLPAINDVANGAIPDVAEDEAVYKLYRAGILTGSDIKGTFLPESSIQRSEVAAIVTRMALPELRQSVNLGKTEGVLRPDISVEGDDDDRITIRDEEDDDEKGEDNVQAVIPSNPEYVDKNNALTKPFDEVYPDLFASGEFNYSDEQLLIKVSKSLSGMQQSALEDAGVNGLELFMDLESGKWYRAYVSDDVTKVMARVRALAFVDVAEYDFTYEADAIVLDSDVQANTNAQDQWYLASCGIQDGWGYLKKPHHRPGYDEENGSTDSEEVSGVVAGDGIVVAVIDTGVDYTHEDLAANIWVNSRETNNNGIDDDGNGYVDDYYGANVITNEGSAMDDQGHGTHVAGIIAGVNNDTGIVGIAYNARIMPIKAGMASGYFNQSDIAEAIIYAYEQGADVINMSFGGTASSIAVQDALTTAYTRCVLVAAAGNDGLHNEGFGAKPTYPAALAYVLGVMSVDENGVESDFTNYDVTAFNSVEYEVYAPGEELLSTIPGNRYATWSGTSMATPVVSAMAALLRSEFRDNSTYPTKFIYGQICATGTEHAACCGGHGAHYLPAIVDVYNALTVLPTPDVGVTDYTIFDTVGLMDSTVNDGDGVIDAGETIAIGFTLRNKWGKSENTVVAVDALSAAGIADPYITIHNPSVNYGSVGTYSTQDAGKVMDGDLWIGWENPICITIASNCPNDYVCKLNIQVTSENALDAADSTVYSSEAVQTLGVRNGTVLPSRIKEDMTLTNEQLYIIPYDTLIMEGATVTVEQGARIQFWSNEPQSAYEDAAIAILTVEGTLICNGTEEYPIEMFPSERMDKYRVEINERGSGVVQLRHTNIVNPYLCIGSAENCEFSQNYHNEPLKYIDSSDPSYSRSGNICLRFDNAKQCAFYQLGYYGDGAYFMAQQRDLWTGVAVFDTCIFVDCQGTFGGGMDVSFINCVFYGNNNYLGNTTGGNCVVDINTTQRNKYTESGKNTYFTNNAIISRLNDDDISKWLLVEGQNYMSSYTPIPLDGNWWGTTNETLIDAQIRDFDDYSSRADLVETPYLTEAPEDVWPFVTNVGILDAAGNETVLVGNETLTFYVEFNRDMDTSIPLEVAFGSAYPCADYAVDGEWINAHRWEGNTTLNTLVEGGYQYMRIDNGKAADAPMKLYRDWGRFPFEIDTSEALAMSLQGYATENGIQLTWTQDDFDTLMGYNIYRAEQDEDAYYQRLNSSIIPVGSEAFFDDTVEPAKDYYYIFTVVKTDLTESEPSGKRQISSLDTMAPVMYHTPVYEAYVGNNIVISATVTDNLAVKDVTLYYSVAGGAWQEAEMQKLNDKYSALISGNNVTMDGVRYYIVATDGVSTVYRGSEDNPYTITVKEAPTSLMPGDVNGDGVIGIADALLVLRAKNNKVVLTSEQFIRADLDEDGILSAAEALKILRYANGEISSLQ